jgi:phosphoribosylanthranilate isomerase
MANWAAAARLAASRPIVLAGGLNAANVVAAIDCVRPWAIDVSSGVEDAPGLKNPDKMRALFATLGKNGRDGRGLIPR